MALTTYPLNNVEYGAEDAELYNCTRGSGVYAESSFNYTLTGTDNIITIGTGVGWIKNGEFSGKVVALKQSLNIDMGISTTVSRTDAIVIQFDLAKNETNIIVKQPSGQSIVPEVVRDGSVYELHLYHVHRKANKMYISPEDITDLRLNPTYCGLMADSVTSVDTGAIESFIKRYNYSKSEVDSKLSALDSYVDVVESQLAATTAKADDAYEYVQQVRVELLDKADKAATVMPSQYSTTPDEPTVVTDEMFYVNMSMNSAYFDISQAPSHVRFVWNTFAGALYMQNGTETMSLTVYESGGKVYTGNYVTVTGSGAGTYTSSLFVIDVYKRSATEAVVFVAPESGVGTYTKPEVDALIAGCGAPAVNYVADPSDYTDSSNAYQLPAGVTVVDVSLGNSVTLFVKAPLNGTATLYFNDAGEGGSALWVASASVNGDHKLTGLLYTHHTMSNIVEGQAIDTYVEHQIYNMQGQYGGRAVVEIANVDGHGDYFTAHVYNYI